MEYRNYKATAVRPSLLGLGCMRLPRLSADSEAIDTAAAQAMVDEAYAHGVRYFDTAYTYHAGESQIFIGQALKKFPRESFYLATKMPLWKVESRADMEEVFAQQLMDCQVEYFDFYLFHAVSNDRFEKMEKLGLYDFLNEQKAAGRIKHLGFSFHDSAEVLEKVCSAHPWDFAQLQLNYLDWTLQGAKQQYEILERFGIPCIVMEPVRGGTLADLGENANSILRKASARSIASWAIRYAASLPNVLVVLSGMSNMEQLQDNLATMDPFVPLSDAECETLASALEAFKEQNFIPCTGCRYCMDCPFGVDIPAAFHAHNTYALGGNREEFLHALAQAQPGLCQNCGACVTQCPQSISIPQRMKALAELL